MPLRVPLEFPCYGFNGSYFLQNENRKLEREMIYIVDERRTLCSTCRFKLLAKRMIHLHQKQKRWHLKRRIDTITGIIEEVNETTLRISELPIRRWTQDYKEFFESIMTGNNKIKDPFIKVTFVTSWFVKLKSIH